MFSASVAEDVSFGPLNLGLPEEEVRRRVSEALAAVGLAGCVVTQPAAIPRAETKSDKRRMEE